MSAETIEFTSRLIEKKLADFGVSVTVVAAQAGPVITRYEIEPATGVKGSQIVNLAKDLARALSLVSIRVVETIPGKNLMGLELPNPRRQMVKLSEILGSQTYHASHSVVTMALGKDIAGNPVVADLAKMPHLLVAGTTGSGKSVGINAMILSLLYKADASHTRLILIDPKMLEMSVYEGIPHLLAPVVTDMRQAGNALNWCVGEMEKRYRLMSKMGVRNLAGYNTKIRDAIKREEPIPNPFSLTPDQPEPLAPLPTIVVVIDELADLMMVVGKKIEELIARLAQKARAAGIHLILATQRPSVDVITGLIKANIPTRIAFQVSSKIDSRTILDQMGAETLLGQGDMLYMPPGTGLPVRVHGAFVSDDEVHRVVESLKAQGEPNYIEGLLEGGLDGDGAEGAGSVTGIGGDAESDPMYDQACEVVLKHRRASISLVQRHLRIGYNRAARLLEQMEQSGMVSAMQSNGNRDILVPAAAERKYDEDVPRPGRRGGPVHGFDPGIRARRGRQRAGAAARFRRQGERGHRLVLAIHGERPGPHPAGANRHVLVPAPRQVQVGGAEALRAAGDLGWRQGLSVRSGPAASDRTQGRRGHRHLARRDPVRLGLAGAVVRGVGAAVQGRPGLAARQAAQRRRRFSRVDIGLKDNLPARVELLDSFGQTTRVDLSGITPNPSIGAKEFQFTAPKGVDVVKM